MLRAVLCCGVRVLRRSCAAAAAQARWNSARIRGCPNRKRLRDASSLRRASYFPWSRTYVPRGKPRRALKPRPRPCLFVGHPRIRAGKRQNAKAPREKAPANVRLRGRERRRRRLKLSARLGRRGFRAPRRALPEARDTPARQREGPLAQARLAHRRYRRRGVCKPRRRNRAP